MRRLVLLSFVSWALVHGGDAAEPRLDFNYDIRPILSAKCFHCHGTDDKARKAKLRLDLREDALRERDGVRPIVPGDVKESELVARITSTDREEVMPPPKDAEALTPTEVEVLRRWIAEGAEYKEHWAWSKPVRADRPAAGHPIDAFVRARLAASGLAPSPEADRPTLIRRLSLDLIGLPPTPAEVDAFASDPAPDANERLVDRLLASPHFGEKWARLWLDLARYADSTGYGSDKFRLNIWPYRDWVINAFNRNLPYDQFTIEQLAGDLLPNATPEQITATAFHRNTMTNVEGGIVPEEYRVAAVKDRIATTGQVWMGLTVGCAQCHTHKFDPITQTDYYRLYGTFNQTADANREDEEPKMPLPTAEESTRLASLQAELSQLEERARATPPELEAELHEWEAKVSGSAGSTEGNSKTAPAPLPPEIQTILALEPSEREPAQRAQLLAYFRPLSAWQASVKRDLVAKRAELARVKPVQLPVMRELPTDKRRVTHVLAKGNYLAPGDPLESGLLSSFATFLPPSEKIDRLTVARWIVHPENPLTARVAVNRIWAQLFGTGLVETEEDFGTQGALPTHPALLDWLAVTFQSPKNTDPAQLGLGWDLKALIRLMVTSSTYRQTSRVSPEALAKDARNRLLSHASRRRLEAEVVRDQALAISGLLSAKIGGPSVYPPQPDGLWKVAFNGGQNAYPTSKGEDRYRRGLYTFWRRTMPPPSLTTFDAPSRESCTVRRIGTNTPLQAFVTLNDPVYVECAQAFARRIVREGGGDAEGRVRWAWKAATAHEASPEQIAKLRELLASEIAQGKSDAAGAAQLATSETEPLPAGADASELAAWTVIANVLLNLDAVLTKG